MNSHKADDLQQDLIRDLKDVDTEIALTKSRINDEYYWLKKQITRREEMMAKLHKTTE